MKTIDHAFCTCIGIDGVVMGTALCVDVQLCVVGLVGSSRDGMIMSVRAGLQVDRGKNR